MIEKISDSKEENEGGKSKNKKKSQAETVLIINGVETGESSSDENDEEGNVDEALPDIEQLFAIIEERSRARARADRAAREIAGNGWRWDSQYRDAQELKFDGDMSSSRRARQGNVDSGDQRSGTSARAGSLLKPATTQMRADALEQFGLGREVPPIPKYPVPRFYNSQEPPRVIHKIWIGDRAISEANIQKLRRTLVQAGSSKFELRLHLDISDPVAHEKTMAILKPLIDDGLKVVELKSENFFKKFQSEKYFDQYKFYLERDNLNYAGATNVLRYRMIYHEGGIYSDMDDVLMGPLDIGKIKNGDVVVFPPFEGLGFEYNNSFFGSSKKNPTLDKLSNESYKKFQGNRNEIKNRPYFDHSKSRDKQSDRFYRYMKIRSETDGPALFSSVVSETIPARGAFKAWKKILGRKGIAVSGDLEDRYLDASRNFEALDGVYDVGADHTSL